MRIQDIAMKLLNESNVDVAAANRLKQPESPLRRTYMALSFLIVIVTLAFLLTIWVYREYGDDTFKRGSISAYYYADDTFTFRMRDVFVAAFSMAAVLLIAYRGYSWWENWLLNFAGICLLGVISCPMDPPICPSSGSVSLSHRATVHYISAFLFYGCLFVVCVCSMAKASKMLEERLRKWFRIGYFATSIAMLIFPFLALAFYLTDYPFAAYVSECIGVLVFCTYWIIKSCELLFIWRRSQEQV